jgi:pimeloyl-ACP methyl ester carboxylesterase
MISKISNRRGRTVALPLLVAWLAAGCGEGRQGSPQGDALTRAASPLSQGVHVFRTADGCEMPYVVAGAGTTTVLLVHCWMCDRDFWEAQTPVLQDRYRVIAVDLPGHGRALDAPRELWTVESYGRDVAGLLEQLELEHVILVGHSMGAPVALRAAALAGGRVRGIVAVDALHDAEFSFEGSQVEQLVGAFEGDFRGTCAMMVEHMFVEEGVESVEARVRRVGCEESNPTVGQGLLRSFATIDFPTWFRDAGVPVRAINAAGGTPTRIDTNRKYADFDAVLMEGVGHYPHMTRPEEFNRLLLGYLDELAG